MCFLPDRSRFDRLAQQHRFVPVYRRLLSDSLTPLSAFARLDTGSCGCLFESVIGGERVGRWSFLAAEPFLQFEARGTAVHLRGHTVDGLDIDERFDCDDPFAELHRRMSDFQPARLEELPPFTSGVVGFASYDAVRYVERLPNAPPDDLGLPDLSFAFYDRMVVFDNVNKTLDVVVLARIDDQTPEGRAAAYNDACRRVDATVSILSAAGEWPQPADIDPKKGRAAEAVSNLTQEQYTAAVEKAIDYIHAGDIFQVVLSQRFQTEFNLPPLELYRTLRVVNPSPFMFHLRTPDVTLVGSSPEIMVRVADNTVTVRPLAGTRPRGNTPDEDKELATSLLDDPKERAEHVMLIDLGRNDVGRVAEIGSVELSDVMCIERYSHVMHLTSNVNGRLAEGRTAFDALRACLPAGTVSGAPKIRAMEIIDELEPTRRGPYAGAVGYIDFSGAMDTCITLRTVVLHGGKAYVQAGAGIVADSVPQREYEETVNKARGLLVALELTRKRLAATPA
ncbi:MAG: anthranilate synthase component I [Planctomycetota bacterium]|jgi:anthranilate synthase component I|nr:anthranilate synthase component I [Planctomycetota bacterium]MDA0970225.1 anthranilate synthase component I [Planctomycetota bacterium]